MYEIYLNQEFKLYFSLNKISIYFTKTLSIHLKNRVKHKKDFEILYPVIETLLLFSCYLCKVNCQNTDNLSDIAAFQLIIFILKPRKKIVVFIVFIPKKVFFIKISATMSIYINQSGSIFFFSIFRKIPFTLITLTLVI